LDTFDKMMTLAQGILGVNQPDPEEFQTQEDFKQADRWHGIGELAGLAPALAMPLVGVMKGLKAGATVAADAHELQQPMRAYHGTRSASLIEKLKPSTGGEYGPGIYLSQDPNMADFFATHVAKGPEGPSIIPVDVHLKNPFRVNKTDWIKMTEKSTPSQVQKRLQAKGYDGIIGVGLTGQEQVVAFSPEQVNFAIKPAPTPIKSFHGSPHDFDQFSLSKIGTGEGAQAYGHGLYFAENEGVAQDYRKKLSKFGTASEMPEDLAKSIEFDGKVINGSTPSNQLTALESAALAKHYAGGIQQRAIEEAERDLKYLTPGTPAYEMDKATLDALKTNDLTGRIKPIYGRTYEVNIHASPDELLDWDKPLSQQPQKVQALLKDQPALVAKDGMTLAGGGKLRVETDPDFGPKYFLEQGGSRFRLNSSDVTNLIGSGSEGKSLYQAVMERYGGDQVKASEALKDAGIKGIQYLDQGSRAAGEGTKNFVIFDDKIIEIAKKYGLSLPVAASLYKWQQSQKGVE